MTVYNRIRKLREQLGLSQQELAELVGFKTASAVNKIELGLRDINQSKIIAFANALKTTPAYLMCWDNNSSETDERTLDKSDSKKRGIMIPILGKVQAGIPITAVEEVLDYEEIDEKLAATGEFFGLIVRGDSMQPLLFEGDTVIIRMQSDVNSGDIAVVLIENENATIKRIKKYTNGIDLVSENKNYPVMTYKNKEIENLPIIILGKAMEVRRKL